MDQEYLALRDTVNIHFAFFNNRLRPAYFAPARALGIAREIGSSTSTAVPGSES